jgi:hypothetical protein
MKRIDSIFIISTLLILIACNTPPLTGQAEILQSWHGDFPVPQLNLLPDGQQEQGIGFIGDASTFEGVWKVFMPDEGVPEIDFKGHLVFFARNTQFYNRIRIGQINVREGVAEVLAMETMSAMPIEKKVAMSMAVVARQGIKALQTADETIPLK